MPIKRAEMATRVCLPQTNSAIPTPAGDRRPIWTKRDADDPIRMSNERVEMITRDCIPELDGATAPSCDGHPSGLNDPVCPASAWSSFPVFASHRRRVPPLPEARVVPSELNETLLTPDLLGTVSVRSSLPVFASHRRRVLSAPPLAIIVPSGLNETLITPDLTRFLSDLVCPVSVRSSFPSVRIPETDGAVRTPTGDRRPIRAKRDAVDCKRMSGEFAELAPGAHIPEMDDAVLTLRWRSSSHPG